MENAGILPPEVRFDNELKASEKILYAEISILVNEEGCCWFNNSHFGNLFRVENSTINNWLSNLEKQNHIKIVNVKSEERVKIIKRKGLEGLGLGVRQCQWCGINTSTLVNHHFPIPKSEGGESTVKICPNCHNEFHYMEKKLKIKDVEGINRIKKRLGVIV